MLNCPRCGAELLHHVSTTVYDRKEDAPTVVETTVSKGHVEVDPKSDGIGNPSSRRDGVVIAFTCEGCGDEPIELGIAQHKGSTEIGWRYFQKG